ncbi:hypothetical protein NQ317_005367 [Molorchus minor]|uniref:Rab-GAP TBC domain-containing protein n=1 Tax=Molorchus minor TaxID=1323400 RepID=A0ABQ9IUR5_9CUCU|nr:hypothetical protein NQ317_005367 [Molorchus minor]
MEMMKLARKYSTDARQIDSDNICFTENDTASSSNLYLTSSLPMQCTIQKLVIAKVCRVWPGVLLMYMNEEDAFWAVHILLTDPKYAMHGLYKEGFPKLDEVPFSLCLRIWDIYLFDGERVITAMAYTILKLHKRQLLKLNDMDSIVHYIQVKLYKDFEYDEDTSIRHLEHSMEVLKRNKLDLPGPPTKEEVPNRPFGFFKEPTFEQMKGDVYGKEKETNKIITVTIETGKESAERDRSANCPLATLWDSQVLMIILHSIMAKLSQCKFKRCFLTPIQTDKIYFNSIIQIQPELLPLTAILNDLSTGLIEQI